jgi:hypothetical protein
MNGNLLSWRQGALALMLTTGLAACGSKPVATEQVNVSKASVETAQTAMGPSDAAIPEMAKAREKLAQADAASKAGDAVKARRLAEQADIDAQVARSKAAADSSQKAAAEIDVGLANLRDEMSRKAAPAPAPAR